MKMALLVMITTPEHMARIWRSTLPLPTASTMMGPSGQPLRSTDQGEAAALLNSRQPLLVHAGGVNLSL